MSKLFNPKNFIFFGWAVAGIVIVISLLDLILGIPFSRQTVMDIMLLLGSGILAYLAFDAFRDLR
ncbi:hypothetical protein [Calycomorphotria hydatis]|uniref:Uncharacterized protein n=1 Tax=Calycomorphotria hydatis TaxID=2528027 RepID=A0A517TCH5_9PLAN|nr:hypothetical protein [Calycomorphotria hydatis]QDT66077.1 hypothetical protein V22_33410 [Calycomorphotria hydatis]